MTTKAKGNDEQPYFLAQHQGLVASPPEDEFLHPTTLPGSSLSETQYFGICMPKERIHGLFYCWHHPNLKTVTGGVWVFQGMKLEPLSCEMYDWQDFMSDDVLANDFRNFTLENGYGMQALEPLKRQRVTYADPARGNSFDLEYQALAPPASWGGGKHYDQAMKVRGSLQLAGKHYDVDCYNIRDHSWGRLRPEAHMKVPPMSWTTGVFRDDFFFNCTAFDHPELCPEWAARFPEITGERTLMGGWIHRDGVLTEIVRCRKKTYRDQQTLMTQRIEMEVVDSASQTYMFTGEVIAGSTAHVWRNMRFNLAMVRWTCRGETGHGDSQEVLFHDYIRAAVTGLHIASA